MVTSIFLPLLRQLSCWISFEPRGKGKLFAPGVPERTERSRTMKSNAACLTNRYGIWLMTRDVQWGYGDDALASQGRPVLLQQRGDIINWIKQPTVLAPVRPGLLRNRTRFGEWRLANHLLLVTCAINTLNSNFIGSCTDAGYTFRYQSWRQAYGTENVMLTYGKHWLQRALAHVQYNKRSTCLATFIFKILH